MSILAPHETLAALGHGLLPLCDSRSLFKDRFSDPQAKDQQRKDWFKRLIAKEAASYRSSQIWLPAGAEILHARLMSRLMVDLAGGVMQNANLNLNRYGYPLIPGSAVKGLARRMALQALRDWMHALDSTGQQDFDAYDACAPCCEGFTSPTDMLAAIARVFGWVKDEWKAEKNRDNKTKQETTWKSDFGWACHGDSALLAAAWRLAGGHDHFTGTVAFIAASPNADPKLELDVVTPHHTKYHSGETGYEHAPDTEDPIPVFFPAVRSQTGDDHFAFPLIPLRLAQPGDLALAKRWLAHGLELFGLGAKANAGYGWFEVDARISARIATEKRQREEAIAVANLEPCSQVIAGLASMPEQQLAGILNSYSFDPRFWPKDKSPLFEVTLLHHVLTSVPHLRQSKKGGKAVELLAAKYNRPLP